MADPAVQKFILKAIMSLPSPVLRAMSGGGVVYRGGRTLDPRFQFLTNAAAKMPSITSLSPDEARAASAGGLAAMSGPPEPGVRNENLTIDGPGGAPLKLRAYRPAEQDSGMPLIVFAHFGGGVIGDLETCHAFCGILARIVRTAVISVDYRLAPDHRFPAGLDDVTAAFRWARDNAARFGALPGAAAIGGDSMGGNFSAIIAQQLTAAGEAPALQLLIYPAVDVASETASMTTYGDSYPLSRPIMDWFMGHYMGPDANPADPRLSPNKTQSLAGLPPAVVVTAGFDPLVDQGEAYAKRLTADGVPTTYRCYDSLAHGFTAFTGAIPAADAACREIARLVRERLAP